MEDTKELLEEYVKEKLKEAEEAIDSDREEAALKEAMSAMDRLNDLYKTESNSQSQENILNFEKEKFEKEEIAKKKQSKSDKFLKIAGIVTPIMVVLIEVGAKLGFANLIYQRENDGIYPVSTPGRTLKDFCSFRK